MNLPSKVLGSRLCLKLAQDSELMHSLITLRQNTEALAETISRSVPMFTDHSILHMDALWAVSDRVLTSNEIDIMTSAEVFLLACGFYLHDIGMAYAATADGLERVKSSSAYRSFVASTGRVSKIDSNSDANAIAAAVRQMHAGAAIELATVPVPGTSIYLFEPRNMRETWATTCGRIAASHHWSLDQLEREFGSLQSLPMPGGRKS